MNIELNFAKWLKKNSSAQRKQQLNNLDLLLKFYLNTRGLKFTQDYLALSDERKTEIIEKIADELQQRPDFAQRQSDEPTDGGGAPWKGEIPKSGRVIRSSRGLGG